MEVAKTSRNKTKTRASLRLASIDKDVAHGTPDTDTGGSFTEAPPALAQPLATAPDSPRPAHWNYHQEIKIRKKRAKKMYEVGEAAKFKYRYVRNKDTK